MPSGPFTLTSDAFAEGGAIPTDYSCEGTDISPALAWTGTPAGTAELVLVVDDPDAGGFVHWIALIDGAEVGLPRGISPTAQTPQQGTNSFGEVGWSGPCPPSGTHHYRFTLTAIAVAAGLTGNPSVSEVRGALSKATVLGTATVTGTYRKT
jgi:Raf kinase inhibitor-like YbhB/YbcL family protein